MKYKMGGLSLSSRLISPPNPCPPGPEHFGAARPSGSASSPGVVQAKRLQLACDEEGVVMFPSRDEMTLRAPTCEGR